MDKEQIIKIATNKSLPRHTRKELSNRAHATGDFGERIYYGDTILYAYDTAREEGIRIAVAFYRDLIGKEPDTDTIVDLILQVYDDALQGSL